MKKLPTTVFAPLALTLLATSALAGNDPPQVSIEGLELVEKDRRGEIYADPGADWSEYSQIQLERATVSFRKNWQRDQNRYDPWKVKNQDVEKIKSGLSDLFHDVFTEELSTNGGYTITEASGADVMIITPRIVDLDIHAPDTMRAGVSRSYTEQTGRMTLMLEIYDSLSGDLIAKASDRQDSPRKGYMQWSTSVSNSAEARRMLQRWASALRVRLDEARGQAAAED